MVGMLSRREVSRHDKAANAWIIIDEKVVSGN